MLTNSPYKRLQKGYVKWLQIPSVCEAGCGDVFDDEDWAFLPALSSKKEHKKKGFTCRTEFVYNKWYRWNNFRRGQLGVFTCISQGKKKKERKKQKGSSIWNYIGLKHDNKLVLTYSPYKRLQREYVKWLQIPSVCEAGCGDVVDDDDWAFPPGFQKRKKKTKVPSSAPVMA